MPASVVVGTQWGDEGKGKATDYLADRMDMVVRYQGGNNAGHTILAEGHTLKLQLIPSGILYPHITSVIADGVVVDPRVLIEEMDGLAAVGVDPSGLIVSGNCHMIMPYHLELEKVTERFLGKNALGTTKRGIGPAYGDKAARIGLRIQDLFDEKILRQKLEIVLKEKNLVLTRVYGRLPLTPDLIVEDYLRYAERLRSHVSDTSKLIHDALRAGKNVLLEGAQGTMLDLDKGTYPFVTSSNPVTGYALASAGIGPREVDRVIGITKAYVTRVGAGPFPTEDHGADGERLGELGREFGTVTGRKRRCGWFDAVILRYAARVNGLTELFITKLDVLSGFETLKVCTAYRAEGETFEDVPSHQSLFHAAEPQYEELEGWAEDLTQIRSFGDLPAAARKYLERLADLVGVPVSVVSVGPGREQSLPAEGPAVEERETVGTMKVLVVGGGGREHALTWRLERDASVAELVAAPGNPGIARHARCVDVSTDDVEGIVALVEREDADLTVVGPEGPLVAGLADRLRERGRAVFGPSADGARLEGSKAWAKDLCERNGIPAALSRSVSSMTDARRALDAFGPPFVVKADGLAAGKGVVVTADRAEAEGAARACLEDRAFGDAGATVVIEEHLEGREVSAFALTDGDRVLPLALAQDFKRVGDGDTGPNTGGMGAYSPVPFVDAGTEGRIWEDVVSATVRAMIEDDVRYQGVLYAGLMLTPDGPKVLEFNCRFGDPETQVLVPRVRSDLAELFHACATGTLAGRTVEVASEACVSVVLASGGYPGPFETGREIHGLDEAAGMDGALVFHAGTSERRGRVVASGGRVLSIGGLGATLAEARDRAYEACSRVGFDGMHRRSDIAAEAAGEIG